MSEPRRWTLETDLEEGCWDWMVVTPAMAPYERQRVEVIEAQPILAEREQMLDLLERLVGADVLCLPNDQQSDDEAAATALLRQAGRSQPKEAAK